MTDSISILLVEDEPLIRFDVASQLEDSGFIVFEAPNAAEAIKILHLTPGISVLFADIDMPGPMDGLTLAAAVRDRWPPVKIIVTSGHRRVEITDMPDGCVFFSKPYAHLAVLISIGDLLAA